MDNVTLQELKKSLEEEHEKLVGELKSVARQDQKMLQFVRSFITIKI